MCYDTAKHGEREDDLCDNGPLYLPGGLFMKNLDQGHFRLVTKADFDGLACALLLREIGMIDDILFVHPKDVQDGKIPLTQNDIVANLPYASGALMVFDHHSSEINRVKIDHDNWMIDQTSPSAARVLYNSLGGKKRFPHISEEFLRAVDRSNSANYTLDEILNPEGWVLLSFITDARTGFGRYHHFTKSNKQLMYDVIDYCRKHPIDEIFKIPDIRERIDFYFAQQHDFQEQLKKCSKKIGHVVVTDYRNEPFICVGNRFMVYALFPDALASLSVFYGKDRAVVVLAAGKSILHRDAKMDLGALMLSYGGGGHKGAASCQIPLAQAETVKQDVITKINEGI